MGRISRLALVLFKVSLTVIVAFGVVLLAIEAGWVRAGAVVLGDSRPCGNPGCRVEFVPRVPWQRFHSGECGKITAKLAKDAKKKLTTEGTEEERGKNG